mmetsp:Transcript_27894/g.81939  ORF Transcript_27894/g.81939 Transcript_27894/m.81939 type:complete len:226 (-) Transcript_27894:762-1439(-)
MRPVPVFPRIHGPLVDLGLLPPPLAVGRRRRAVGVVAIVPLVQDGELVAPLLRAREGSRGGIDRQALARFLEFAIEAVPAFVAHAHIMHARPDLAAFPPLGIVAIDIPQRKMLKRNDHLTLLPVNVPLARIDHNIPRRRLGALGVPIARIARLPLDGCERKRPRILAVAVRELRVGIGGAVRSDLAIDRTSAPRLIEFVDLVDRREESEGRPEFVPELYGDAIAR